MASSETVVANSRRSFCKTLLSGSIGAMLPMPSTVWAQDHRFRLRYILASCMYGMGRLEDIVPEVRKAGAEAIDIWPRVHGAQREQIDEMGYDKFRELLAKYNVRLGVLTRYDLGPFRLREEISVAKKLGASVIVTGSRPAGKDLKADVRKFVEDLKPHVAVAEEAGITLAIENHGGALINQPDSIRYFAQYARSARLGIAYAPYHLPQDEKLQAALLTDLGPKLAHIYAWQHHPRGDDSKENQKRQLPGLGRMDFTPMLAALKKINYRGYTEVFMHATPQGTPIAPTTSEATRLIAESRAYLEDRMRMTTGVSGAARKPSK